VPEIEEGIVEIKGIAREAGHRTKVAVMSNDPDVDPVGACVGPGGQRARGVQKELHAEELERIDIVRWADEPEQLVGNALSPAKVSNVYLYPDDGTAMVVVPDYQLSLAIGREGQNARLAARLTGWRIDIKSETQFAEEQRAFQEAFDKGLIDEYGNPLSDEGAKAIEAAYESRRGGPPLGARGRRGRRRRADPPTMSRPTDPGRRRRRAAPRRGDRPAGTEAEPIPRGRPEPSRTIRTTSRARH
jgi:transcription termination/antitermination protein NusA